jgi:Helix-turn-helix domain
MAPKKEPIIGSRDAMRILDIDRATVIRWGRAGRIKIVGQVGRQGTVLFDRESVELLAAELALARRQKLAEQRAEQALAKRRTPRKRGRRVRVVDTATEAAS